MKYLLLIITICFFAFQGMAQSIDRQVISSFGLLTPSTSATAGEVVTETLSGSFILNQGFQQGESEEINTNLEEIKIEIDFKLFPNPIKDIIHFAISADQEIALQFIITNQIGQILSKDITAIIQDEWKSSWDISDFNYGQYFLVVRNMNGEQVKSVAFVKQ